MDTLQKINDQKTGRCLANRRRIVFEGAVYHITQRAPGRECVFLEDDDYLSFLKILKETVLKFKIQIIAFALLPNHLHLLLQITEKDVSSPMKHLFEQYAKYFNKKYQRKGHVFCGRFRSSLCQDSTYFLAISVYIHLNPFRAGLCSGFSDYRWTSVHLFTDPDKKTFVSYEKVLLLLDKDPEKARQQYVSILTTTMKIKASGLHDTKNIQKTIKSGLSVLRKIINVANKGELDRLINEFKGRERICKMEDQKTRKYLLEQLVANGNSPEEIQDLLGMSKANFYRVARQFPL